ncbi:hypothetical protein GCM10023115_29250 [Pontixanthobacter gangjinensis]|uniref:Uncharacterized protein n=1 Tax=Christiangramia aestuarii TaxID=1028746 RepID=A0A7K1LMZ7_9FLAO|nr:hypothetical protein [Christiangramia aestuarii]MUP42157.1 hypothetical protein [Christiangramia aestuarii]
MKNLIKLLAILAFIFTSCEKDSSYVDSDIEGINIHSEELIIGKGKSNTVKTTSDVFNPILGEVVGEATLLRNQNGLSFSYKSDGLTPGYAYTMWWVIWNKPENCATPGACLDPDVANPDVEVSIMAAGGHVVGKSGKGYFGGHINEGDDSGSVNELLGLPPAGGLQEGNSFGAEVHLVVRSHGPAIPGEVSEQISTYVGGCDAPFAFPPFSEIPDEIGECGEIEAAIFAPVEM